MSIWSRDRVRVLGGWLLVVLTPAMWAADGAAARSARLSYLSGAVTAQRTDNTGADAAQLNMPLTEGMRVVTAGDGQAEIEFEDGSVLRLTPNSAVNLTSLSTDGSGNYETRADVLGGLVYAELRSATRFTYVLGAGSDAISPVTNATLRVMMDQPPAVIGVLDGSIRVVSGGSAGFSTDVRAGESLTDDARGAGRYLLSETVSKETWDGWNEERDQAAANEAALRTSAREGYAGDQGYGWSDLDAQGSWYDVPGQGQVWQPTVAAVGGSGFDPYGFGSWVWYPTSGYVWSSGYSWGWTPYRCGSWNYINSFGWGWAPGSTCGRGGWAGGVHRGGGGPINIGQGPPNYHRPRPPLPPPGPIPVHGVVPVNVGGVHGRPVSGGRPDGARTGGDQTGGDRTIAGHTVRPLPPLGSGYTQRGGSAVGSQLRRDFPVDRGSRTPLMGVPSGTVPVIPAGAAGAGMGWRGDVGQRVGAAPVGGVVQGSVPAGGGAGRPVMRPPPPGMGWPTVRPRPGQTVPGQAGPGRLGPGRLGQMPAVQVRPIQPMRPMPAPVRSVPAPTISRPAAPAPAPHR